MPTPARRAISSSEASVPRSVNTSVAAASSASRLRWASARGAGRARRSASQLRDHRTPLLLLRNQLANRRQPPYRDVPEAPSASPMLLLRSEVLLVTVQHSPAVAAHRLPPDARGRRARRRSRPRRPRRHPHLPADGRARRDHRERRAARHPDLALGFSADGLSWVINAYTLTFGGLLLLGARAGDILGRRRVFLGGIALFTLASLAGGFARTRASCSPPAPCRVSAGHSPHRRPSRC